MKESCGWMKPFKSRCPLPFPLSHFLSLSLSRSLTLSFSTKRGKSLLKTMIKSKSSLALIDQNAWKLCENVKRRWPEDSNFLVEWQRQWMQSTSMTQIHGNLSQNCDTLWQMMDSPLWLGQMAWTFPTFGHFENVAMLTLMVPNQTFVNHGDPFIYGIQYRCVSKIQHTIHL